MDVDSRLDDRRKPSKPLAAGQDCNGLVRLISQLNRGPYACLLACNCMARSFAPHDDGRPIQIQPQVLGDYFEVITRAVFNAGISWKVIESAWPHMTTRFEGFDPEVIAEFDESAITDLLADDAMIQSTNKVRGTVTNAQTFLDLADAHNGFAGWLHSHGSYDATEQALIKAFKWIGEFGAYWTMYTLGENTPDYGDWCRARGRTPPPGL